MHDNMGIKVKTTKDIYFVSGRKIPSGSIINAEINKWPEIYKNVDLIGYIRIGRLSHKVGRDYIPHFSLLKDEYIII